MKLEELLKQLGAAIGLPQLKLEEGSCRLVFDGALPVDVEEGDGEEEAHLLSHLGPLPPEGEQEGTYFRRLLQANHYGRETGGMTLALVPSEGQFFLCGMVPLAGVTVDSFSRLLARFARESHRWIVELETLGQNALVSPTGDEPMDATGFIRV
jgi:hypothetical protein